MSFSENICKFLKIDPSCSACAYRLSVYGGYGAHIEGAKKIEDVKPDEITVGLTSGKIVFRGKKLSVGAYLDGDVTILGDVTAIERKI